MTLPENRWFSARAPLKWTRRTRVLRCVASAPAAAVTTTATTSIAAAAAVAASATGASAAAAAAASVTVPATTSTASTTEAASAAGASTAGTAVARGFLGGRPVAGRRCSRRAAQGALLAALEEHAQSRVLIGVETGPATPTRRHAQPVCLSGTFPARISLGHQICSIQSTRSTPLQPRRDFTHRDSHIERATARGNPSLYDQNPAVRQERGVPRGGGWYASFATVQALARRLQRSSAKFNCWAMGVPIRPTASPQVEQHRPECRDKPHARAPRGASRPDASRRHMHPRHARACAGPMKTC
jgi:hypothetical protein